MIVIPGEGTQSMQLARYARKFYKLEITTEPAVTAWEASFDRGVTWQPQTTVDTYPAWLVAGPDADPGPAVAVLEESVTPWIRAVDNPEILDVEGQAPRIYLI
jgi:hypothetical protein